MRALFIDGPAAGRVFENVSERTVRVPVMTANNLPTAVPLEVRAPLQLMSSNIQIHEYYYLKARELPFDFMLYSVNSDGDVDQERWWAAIKVMEWYIENEREQKESLLNDRLKRLEDSIERLGKTLTNVMRNHRLSDQVVDNRSDEW